MTGVPARDLALLAALLALLLAWPLRAPPVGLRGEAREGLVVQDIVEHGHWVLPRRNGELPSKPPLYHWMAASLGRLCGLSDACLRSPSALAAIVMAGATFVTGCALGGRPVGWLAVGALLGMAQFWLAASEARVDMLFAACLTVSLAGFHRWYATRGRGARALCWLGAAAAVLAKGPAGLLLPALVIGAFLASQGELALVRGLWSWPLVGTVAAIDLGWYALALAVGGSEFFTVQIVSENLDRFLGRHRFAPVVHEPSFRHFVLRMPLEFARHFLPWNLVLVAAAFRAWHGRVETSSGRFLHAWWIVILAFFSVASGKRSIYLLPCAPPVALLAARVFAEVPGRLRRSAPIAIARRPLAAMLALVAVIDIAVLTGAELVRFHQARRESLAEFAATVARLVPAGAPLYAAASLAPSGVLVLAYRLDRPIPRQPAACTGEEYVLLPEDVARRARDGLEVLARSGRQHFPMALGRRPCPATG